MVKRPAFMNWFAIWSRARLLRKNQKILIVVGTDGGSMSESRVVALRVSEFHRMFEQPYGCMLVRVCL
jgi:hypothetical protein